MKTLKALLKGFFFGTKPENVKKSLKQENEELKQENNYLRQDNIKLKKNINSLYKRVDSLTWKCQFLEKQIQA